MTSRLILLLFMFEMMTLKAKSNQHSSDASDSATSSDVSDAATRDGFTNVLQFNDVTDDEKTWVKLTETGIHVLRAQLDSGVFRWMSRSNTQVTAFLFPGTRWRAVRRLEHIIRNNRDELLFLYFNMEEGIRDPTLRNDFINMTLNTLRVTENLINVIVFSESRIQVTQMFRFMSDTVAFRWTGLIHVTEWFVLTSGTGWSDDINTAGDTFPDFVTVVFPSRQNTTTVCQKSRKELFHLVLDVRDDIFEANPRAIIKQPELLFLEKSSESFQQNFSSKIEPTVIKMPTSGLEVLRNEIRRLTDLGIIRVNARLYLGKQKSSLDGMHLAVSLIKTDSYEGRLVYDGQEGNQTVIKGYLPHLMRTFAEKLGFTYHTVLVNDGGYYGSVTKNQVNGLTGQLYRRETALSIDVMSVIENRLRVIDFVSLPTYAETTKIVYKLPPRGPLDTTYVDIIRPDLTLYLSGTLLVISVACAIVHLSTRSCFLQKPKPFALRHFRLLYHYPEHWCFETHAVYADQSGRILKASWGVFWLVLSSSYSAYLTTSFAVKPKEFRIASLQDMSEYSTWEIGVNGRITSFMIVLNSTGNELHRQVYEKLIKQNLTNPMTFSDNVTYHMERVLAGNYFFLTPTSLTEIPFSTVKRVDPRVRGYNLEGMPGVTVDNIGVPKNVFYKDDLYRCVLKLEEHGIVSALRLMYSEPGHNVSQSLDGQPEPVSFSRVEMLTYVLMAGVGLSLACLLAELAIQKWRDRATLNGVVACAI